MSKSKSTDNLGPVPSGVAADVGVDEQNADEALRQPLTNTAPGSPDYALKGPLAMKTPPMRPEQGEAAGAVPPAPKSKTGLP